MALVGQGAEVLRLREEVEALRGKVALLEEEGRACRRVMDMQEEGLAPEGPDRDKYAALLRCVVTSDQTTAQTAPRLAERAAYCGRPSDLMRSG
jgi:hypothetical protein